MLDPCAKLLMWHHCPEYLWCITSFVVKSFCIFSWHLLHFLAFQKPAAQLKKPSVESAQKKTQESESSDSDSDDESDEVICLWIHMLYLSVDLITFDRCLC